jgi:hypothetical protein
MHLSEQFGAGVFGGWHKYQAKLVTALAPLTEELLRPQRFCASLRYTNNPWP